GHTALPWLVSEIAAPFEAHSGDRGRGACGLYPWSPPSSAPAPQPGQFRAHRAPPAPGPGTPIDRAGWALSPCLALAEGRRFISDQSRRKDLADRPPPERRSPNPQLLTLPEAAAVLLASLQKLQEAGEENFDQTRFLEDSLLNW
uniref:Spexin hormone n=1 Tax=Phocoena sinus TaxID=42100 RepID=A0A8C9BUS1_PHOSS